MKQVQVFILHARLRRWPGVTLCSSCACLRFTYRVATAYSGPTTTATAPTSPFLKDNAPQQDNTTTQTARGDSPKVALSCENDVNQAIHMATEHLRSALQAWSKVEQAKVAAATAPANAGHAPSPTLSLPDSLPAPPATPTRVAMLHEGLIMGKRGGVVQPAVQNLSTAQLPIHQWIRNKRPQFWKIVSSPPSAAGSPATPSVAAPSAAGGNAPSLVSAAATGNLRFRAESSQQPLTNMVEGQGSAACDNANHSERADAGGVAKQPVNGQPAAGAAGMHAARRPQPWTFRNPYKKDVARYLSELLDCDPLLGPVLLEKLSAESLRLLLVMGTASEYYGEDYNGVVEQVRVADKDRDSSISAREYEEWARDSWQQRRCKFANTAEAQPAPPTFSPAPPPLSALEAPSVGREAAARATDGKSAAPTAPQGVPIHAKEEIVKAMQRSLGATRPSATAGEAAWKEEPGYIPWPTYLRLLAAAGAPFLAFGMLDNSILIISGDAVDRTFSATLSLSGMAAAGLGGIFSGVAGIQVHGLAERLTRTAPPKLTAAQLQSRVYQRSTHIGNTLGVVTGLILGMLPLLFIGSDREDDVEEDNDRLRKEGERCGRARELFQEMVQAETHERTQIQASEVTQWESLLSRAE